MMLRKHGCHDTTEGVFVDIIWISSGRRSVSSSRVGHMYWTTKKYW